MQRMPSTQVLFKSPWIRVQSLELGRPPNKGEREEGWLISEGVCSTALGLCVPVPLWALL